MKQNTLDAIALSVRSLAMDAVQRANSGHPGLPMGLAELGALLYGEIVRHHPEHPQWPARDRVVLSAGHGCMLLYALLHLSGYQLPLEQLRQFRQLGSQTPGHPEYGHTPGVETTTGPLGQGLASAVGMAVAERFLAATFNPGDEAIFDHYTYVIVSDGDLMEGITSEACSLAGHLGLGKLIVYYDDNHISIEGNTNLAFGEDPTARFQSYGWHTLSASAYDAAALLATTRQAQDEQARPSFIRVASIIGKGSPNKANSAEVHGAALGETEVLATRRNLGLLEDQEFFIAPGALEFFEQRRGQLAAEYQRWHARFERWGQENPALYRQWRQFHDHKAIATALVDANLPRFAPGDKVATRKASGLTLQAVAATIPNLIGGSADLAPSNNTAMPYGDFSADNPTGRTMHFGVREHAMGALCNGMSVHGGVRPFCATFLVFTDYMRGAMRLAALMGRPVIYVMTHDSIYLGEDGPTHQPIEHLATLRAIPNMRVLRPGDAQETVEAWQMALERSKGPTVLVLTRQGLAVYPKQDRNWQPAMRCGAYIVYEKRTADTSGTTTTPAVTLVATGSEVGLALQAAQACSQSVRVVSMISRGLFNQQPQQYREQIIPPQSRTIVVEAAVAQGWEGFVSAPADLFTLNGFGASGPGTAVAEHFGFTATRLQHLIDHHQSG